MKRIVLILTLSIFMMMTASAAETSVSTASLNARLDLTTQNYVNFNFFSDSKGNTTPLTTLALKSNSNDTLSGTGSFYVVWDVISSSSFELRIYSDAMTNGKEKLNWTLKDESNMIILNNANNYGGTSNNLIYKHDPETNVIGKNDSILLNVTTDDVRNLTNSVYSTTLKVVLESK